MEGKSRRYVCRAKLPVIVVDADGFFEARVEASNAFRRLLRGTVEFVVCEEDK